MKARFALAAELELERVIASTKNFARSDDGQLSEEAKAYLAVAWDKGIASGPGRFGTIEDVIAEARRRLSSAGF